MPRALHTPGPGLLPTCHLQEAASGASGAQCIRAVRQGVQQGLARHLYHMDRCFVSSECAVARHACWPACHGHAVRLFLEAAVLLNCYSQAVIQPECLLLQEALPALLQAGCSRSGTADLTVDPVLCLALQVQKHCTYITYSASGRRSTAAATKSLIILEHSNQVCGSDQNVPAIISSVPVPRPLTPPQLTFFTVTMLLKGSTVMMSPTVTGPALMLARMPPPFWKQMLTGPCTRDMVADGYVEASLSECTDMHVQVH